MLKKNATKVAQNVIDVVSKSTRAKDKSLLERMRLRERLSSGSTPSTPSLIRRGVGVLKRVVFGVKEETHE